MVRLLLIYGIMSQDLPKSERLVESSPAAAAAAATIIIPPDKGSCLKSSLASAERRRDLSLRANARVSHANPPELNRLFIVW